jgi:hypothetical protein
MPDPTTGAVEQCGAERFRDEAAARSRRQLLRFGYGRGQA